MRMMIYGCSVFFFFFFFHQLLLLGFLFHCSGNSTSISNHKSKSSSDYPEAFLSYLHHKQKRSLSDNPEKWLWGYKNDSFPYGYQKEGRIAIILTGQLRSANRTWLSGTLHPGQHSKMFGPADPPTTAMTIIEWIFKPLARKHPIDVFMYQTARPGASNANWDGSPETYQTVLGDTRGCEIFSKNEVFQHTGNRFFCLIEPEEPLMNRFLANYSLWQNYYVVNGPYYLREQALQQLYAIYRGNLAAKQFALANGCQYAYKLRLRPDIAPVQPFPDLSVFDFGPTSPGTDGTIYYANRAIYNNGNEDWFNIGRAADMDHLLDRYVDFISLPPLYITNKPWFTLEQNLLGIMQIRYKIALTHHIDIWMVVIRVVNHPSTTRWVIPPKQNDWLELSTP